jgi:predicted GNAT family acetyltransferase
VVERLSHPHVEALAGFLHQDPVANVFLLGWLRTQEIDRTPWYAVARGGELAAVALVVPERLVVPWSPDPAYAAEIGTRLRAERVKPGMVIGPRAASDALWKAWSPPAPRLWYDQRLYVMDAPPPDPHVPGFRVATMRDVPALIEASARMEDEDLGRDPSRTDPAVHENAVRERIRAGRTFVIDRGGIVFHIHVGTWIAEGCQVGGTYVPPEHRGKGLATLGMLALGHAVLAGPEPPARMTLHVNEANVPAVRVYERSGFRRAHPFRLIAARNAP